MLATTPGGLWKAKNRYLPYLGELHFMPLALPIPSPRRNLWPERDISFMIQLLRQQWPVLAWAYQRPGSPGPRVSGVKYTMASKEHLGILSWDFCWLSKQWYSVPHLGTAPYSCHMSCHFNHAVITMTTCCDYLIWLLHCRLCERPESLWERDIQALWQGEMASELEVALGNWRNCLKFSEGNLMKRNKVLLGILDEIDKCTVYGCWTKKERKWGL